MAGPESGPAEFKLPPITDFSAPKTGALSEAPKPIIFESCEQLTKLTGEELFKYITTTILDAENKAFTTERNTGLHKLVFLTGGPYKDISRVLDASGNSVYIKQPKYAKAPEMTEAIVATSNYLNKIDEDPARVYSEIADVAHNLTLLTVLDPGVKLQHGNKKITYQDCTRGLAESLNIEVRDLLLLSAIKYTQRLESGDKNPQKEDNLIRRAISESAVPYPTADSISRAYGVINLIDRILEKRLDHLASEKGWNLTAPSGNSNHIFN